MQSYPKSGSYRVQFGKSSGGSSAGVSFPCKPTRGWAAPSLSTGWLSSSPPNDAYERTHPRAAMITQGLEELEAATMLQAAARGRAARGKVQHEHQAARVIQGHLSRRSLGGHDDGDTACASGGTTLRVAITSPGTPTPCNNSRPGSAPSPQRRGAGRPAPDRHSQAVASVASVQVPSYARSKALGLSALSLAPAQPYQKPPQMPFTRPSSAHQLGRFPGGMAGHMRLKGSHDWAAREGAAKLHRQLHPRAARGASSEGVLRPRSAQPTVGQRALAARQGLVRLGGGFSSGGVGGA
jgi:hypothetical protein